MASFPRTKKLIDYKCMDIWEIMGEVSTGLEIATDFCRPPSAGAILAETQMGHSKYLFPAIVRHAHEIAEGDHKKNADPVGLRLSA